MAPPLASDPVALKRRLLQAAADGNLGSFKRMARGLDDGNGCLKEAVEAVRERGVGAPHLASRRGRSSVCAYLVEELKVDVHHADDSGYTPLAHAVHGGTVDCVRYLLDHGANTNKRDKDGFAPLHLAAIQGADFDAFSDRGMPLHLAAFFKQDGVMKILLDHHADYNKLHSPVYTPLIMALMGGALKCVKLLVKAGADVKGIGTVTPLMLAANNGLTDFYECLLKAGADPNVRDDFGHLPIEIAAYNNRRKDVEILLPVTDPIPHVRDWSVNGVISYVKSLPSVEDDPLYKLKPADMKLEGKKAYKRKDYFTALKLYSMAVNFCPDDPTLFSNKSLCWMKMGQGTQALMDAQACRMLRPDWPKACYLEGAAQVLLKEYEKACDAFLDGLKMDPWNVEIADALREAFKCLKISYATKVLSSQGKGE